MTKKMEARCRPAPQVSLLRSQRNSSKCPMSSWRLTTGMIEEMVGGWKPICPRPTYVVVPKRVQSRARSKDCSSNGSMHGPSLQRSVDRLYNTTRRGNNSAELSGFLDSDFNYHSYHEAPTTGRQSEAANVSPFSTWSGNVHLQQHQESCDELDTPACLQWRASLGHIGHLLPSSPCEHCTKGKDRSMDVLDLLALPTKKRLKKYRNSQIRRHGPLNGRMSLPDLSAPLTGWKNSSGDLRNLNAYTLAQAYAGTTHVPAQRSHLGTCQKARGGEPLYSASFTMPELHQKRGPFGTITIIPSNPSIPSQTTKGGRYFNLKVQGIQPNKHFSGTEHMLYRRS